jgi:tetratricopeptide (TPR) repeat protein
VKARLSLGVAVALLAIAGARPAYAADADGDASRATQEVTNVSNEASSVQAAIEKAKGQRYTVEQRIANGELLYRSKDYPRAVVVFSEILEEFPDTPAYPDALWLRGETFYAQKEYLSARRDYRAIVDRGTEPRFSPYFGKALGRLVDVCLRIGDLKGLDEVFAKINQVPPSQVDDGLNYAKGKAYYWKQDYGQAQSALSAIPNGSAYTHQARYYQGMVAMRQARPATPPAPPSASLPAAQQNQPATDTTVRATVNYKQAIETFKIATELPPDTEEHRHVIDLSWMAIGRLHYEMENYVSAAEAYSRVGRDSPEFGTMLYELAWVHVAARR